MNVNDLDMVRSSIVIVSFQYLIPRFSNTTDTPSFNMAHQLFAGTKQVLALPCARASIQSLLSSLVEFAYKYSEYSYVSKVFFVRGVIETTRVFR